MIDRRKKLVGRQAVADRLGVSVSTLKRLMSKPMFPKPYTINGGALIWIQSEVDQWFLNIQNSRGQGHERQSSGTVEAKRGQGN